MVLIPEEAEDMWHAFNLIAEGDAVRANTIRKVGTSRVADPGNVFPDPDPDPGQILTKIQSFENFLSFF